MSLTADLLAGLPEAERTAILTSAPPEWKVSKLHEWAFWARPNQLEPPGDWRTWLLLAGRGFGKSRTGAEWVREQVEGGKARRVALVGRTAADVRDVMVEGESGLLAVSPPWFRPKYEPSKRRLTWPNGAIATTYSGDKPDQLRGPQHDAAWADELAAWRYPESWDQLLFGLRLGDDPRVVVTTTPRPVKHVRDLLGQPTTHVTRGSSYENRANLAPAFFDAIIRRYEGTRLGRQELQAELLDDNPYALWKRSQIDALRVKAPPTLRRIVVAIDPSIHDGTADPTEERAEAGIVAAGLGPSPTGKEEHGYVLEDVSLFGSPDEWARGAVASYHRLGADRVVAEVNQGGAMVELTIRTVDRKVSYKSVHASRGKHTRAEPVSALYEQGKVHHVGCFPELEDEMCEWVPGEKSPNRMDALVWALTELMLVGRDRRAWSV